MKTKPELEIGKKEFKSINNDLKELINLFTTVYKTPTERLNAYLEFGAQVIKYENGFISRIIDQDCKIIASISKSKNIAVGNQYHIKDSICKEAVKKGKTLIVNDYLESDFYRKDLADILDVASVIIAPIYANDKLYGTLFFSSTSVKDENLQSDYNVNIVELIAQKLSAIIENYELIDNISQSEELLSLGEKNANIGIHKRSIDSTEMEMSDNFMQIFDITTEGQKSEDIFKKIISSVHKDDIEKVLSVEEKVKNGVACEPFEYRYKDKNEKYKWIRHNLNINKSTNNILGTIQDITEYKKLELALINNKENLQQLIKFTPAAVAMFDKEMRYIAHSNRWTQDYNLEGKEIVGKSHYSIFPDVLEQWKEDHQNVLQGKIVKNTEDKWIRDDGTVVYISYELQPWRDENNSIGGLIMFTQVVTESVNSRLHLESLVEELNRSNVDLEQFAYVASHDLQEPLRMVHSFSQLLNERNKDEFDEKSKQYIKILMDASTRMNDLVNSLLYFSRVGRNNLSIEAIDIKQLLNEKLADLNQFITDKNAKLEISNLPVKVNYDPNQLRIVFHNLITNGIKFNKNENPIIKISAIEHNDHLEISVKDNGIGISEGKEDKIFALFQRLHSKAQYNGTGIGLALSKKIIESNGGKIWYNSEINKGTKFNFSILKEIDL